MADLKKYVVIVAGGRGSRMGSPVPKQFMPLNGKPMLCYAIEAFHAAHATEIILVVPPDEMSSAEIVLKSYLSGIPVTYVGGGETRYQSVQNGLKKITGEGIVFVHDGARPVVSVSLIERCCAQAIARGSAIPAIAVTDSIRMISGNATMPVNRDQLRIIQTPQTFQAHIILPAFLQEYNADFTDEASVVEAHGTKVLLIEGERSNIKVTTPDDLVLAAALLKNRS